MKRNDILGLVVGERGFRYGGREVLRAADAIPCGTCRAAVHFKEIMTLWRAFVERELFPAAARDWEEQARTGKGYAFREHQARGHIAIAPLKRGWRITFSATLSVGDEVRLCRTLTTAWDAAGEHQRKRPARSLQS